MFLTCNMLKCRRRHKRKHTTRNVEESYATQPAHLQTDTNTDTDTCADADADTGAPHMAGFYYPQPMAAAQAAAAQTNYLQGLQGYTFNNFGASFPQGYIR